MLCDDIWCIIVLHYYYSTTTINHHHHIIYSLLLLFHYYYYIIILINIIYFAPATHWRRREAKRSSAFAGAVGSLPSEVSRQQQCLIARSYSRQECLSVECAKLKGYVSILSKWLFVRGHRQLRPLVAWWSGVRKSRSNSETKIKSGRHPVLMASYLNRWTRCRCKKFESKKIEGHMDILAIQQERKLVGKQLSSEHASPEWTSQNRNGPTMCKRELKG